MPVHALIRKYKWMVLLLATFNQCKKPYEPAVLKAGNNYLVVDGFINTTAGGITNVILSRTKNLTDTVITIPERNAKINIESAGGAQYALHEQGEGNYNSNALALAGNTNYRLVITTSNGSRYQSDFVSARQTPAIDSVTWQRDDGVSIFVNTHDPANKTRFYRWQYVETWEYHSKLETPWGVSNGIIFVRTPQQMLNICYNTTASADILLGSSAALSQDVISEKLLTIIPQNDSTLHYRMSILVKQYALTPEAYFYWQIIQKNSTQLGTLFDLQPSQLNGNIHSITNNTEPVVGFVSANTLQEKRIFIDYTDLPDWRPPPSTYDCTITAIDAHANFLIYDYPDPDYTPYYFSGPILMIAKKTCLDCTLSGGTTVKPSFW